MAIDQESIRWATQDEIDVVSGLNNKVPPTPSQRDSGLKRREPFSRQILNSHFNSQYEALVELQEQINDLSISASTGIINTIFPVGAYYITENPDNPNTTLGVGTWTLVEGKYLIGRSTTDPDFDGIGEEFGSKNHTHTNNLTVAGHSITPSELPPHSHNLVLQKQGNNKASEGETYASLKEIAEGDTFGSDTRTTTSVGSGNPHTHALNGGINSASNLPPSRAVNIWRRTA